MNTLTTNRDANGNGLGSAAANDYWYSGRIPILGTSGKRLRQPAGQSLACSATGIACSLALAAAVAHDSMPATLSPVFSEGGSAYYAETAETTKSKARAAIALLDRWLSDESGYDEETWPQLKKALDEDRLSDRRLFDA